MEDAALKKSWRMLLVMSFLLMVLAPLEYLNVISLTKHGLRPTLDYFPLWIYALYALPILNIPCYFVVRKVFVLGSKMPTAKTRSEFERYRTLVIIRMALVQSSYIYGLVIYFLTGGTGQMYYFYAVGVVLSPFAWPRKQEYFNLFRKAQTP